MSYEFSQKFYRDKLSGLGTDGILGPDQPWTAANASQWITQRTRECPTGREILIGGLNPPSYTVDGKKVTTAECVTTGRVKESSRAGYQRVQEWCCPVVRPNVPIVKAVTQEQAEQYATTCAGRIISLPSGQTHLVDLGRWIHKTANIPSALCVDSGIMDGDYKLLCCRTDVIIPTVVKDGKTYYAGGLPGSSSGAVAPTAEQIAQGTAAVAAIAAEQEAVLVASQEPQYSFFQRYGLVLALGAGAVGIGVVAGLIKRRRLNKTNKTDEK